MAAVVDTTLRDRFHADAMWNVEEYLNGTGGRADLVVLHRLNKMAVEGSHKAKVLLAELYAGEETIMGNWEIALEEPLQNIEYAKYWAFDASAGAGFEAACNSPDEGGYVCVNLATVLLKAGDAHSRMRALSLIIKAIANGKDGADTAASLLEEHFKGFDLEAAAAEHKGAPVLTAPHFNDPQANLF